MSQESSVVSRAHLLLVELSVPDNLSIPSLFLLNSALVLVNGFLDVAEMRVKVTDGIAGQGLLESS